MADSFVHLHTHTEYSLLDGAARVPDVVAAAAADGQPALGITDHGNLYGVLDFYKTCNANGIKPIIGTEAYMALESRDERPTRSSRKVDDDSGGQTSEGTKLYYHLTLLAENDVGYRNLLKLASRAFLEGYYYKPRMDWAMFEDHHEGLIATTGCLGSVVQQALLNDNYDEALRRAARLQDIFGRENLYVEMQDHGIDAQHQCNPQLLKIAEALGAPLLATNDLHYTERSHASAHDALLCVQTKSLLADTDRLRFHGEEHYLKSAAQMRALFAELPSSCDNTLAIAERAQVNIKLGQILLPEFTVPEEYDDDDAYLKHLAFEGAKWRWGERLSDAITERLAYELRVISDMGFSSYFLITWDLVKYARSQGIRVGPGRGSAAGCAVAYSLRITDLDPIKYDLLFERFLNPARVSMPDIDIDFDDRRRDDIFRYVTAKYGRDKVAQIITFSSIKARAAVRDATRVMGLPYSLGNRIANAVPPPIMGRNTPLWACLDLPDTDRTAHPAVSEHADGYSAAGELRQMYADDSEARNVIDTALGLEGLRRQDSVHAAAVVISPEPLMQWLPVQRKPESGTDPTLAPIVTQFDMGGVEELGLLKMDFLGLRTLSIIDDAIKLIKHNTGTAPNIDDVDLNDDATFELLQAGDTLGVFQLESGPVRSLLRSLKPTAFEDVAALVALYRPGPMAADMHNDYANFKNNRKQVEMPHPDLGDILGETYGLMIYQESVMRVAQRIAGYTLAEADDLRKACGKKNRAQIAEHREKFVSGSVDNGYESTLGKQLFDIIEPFADYAFNKSHAFAYGLVAYQTAWLKANHRTEFMAALMTGNKANLERAGVYINECRQVGITVEGPDINESDIDFVGTNKRIRFGLSAVRNIGAGAVEMIVDERGCGGPFKDFYNFCMRVPEATLNKGYVSALAKAGAFVSLGHPRQGLLSVAPLVIRDALRQRRDAESGVQSLFVSAAGDDRSPSDNTGSSSDNTGSPSDNTGSDFAASQRSADDGIRIPAHEADDSTVQGWEKELLGLYVSSHPLEGGEENLRRQTDRPIAELGDLKPESNGRELRVKIGGIATNVERRFSRAGKLMASFTLEDLSAKIAVTVFDTVLEESGDLLTEDALLVVVGRCERRPEDEELRFLASGLEPLSIVRGIKPVQVTLNPQNLDQSVLSRLKVLLSEHSGNAPIRLSFDNNVVQLPQECEVNVDTIAGPLREMLGANAVRT